MTILTHYETFRKVEEAGPNVRFGSVGATPSDGAQKFAPGTTHRWSSDLAVVVPAFVHFPVDMLRYDEAHPLTEADSHIIESTFRDPSDELRVVYVRRYGNTKNEAETWNIERWVSFGVQIVEAYGLEPLRRASIENRYFGHGYSASLYLCDSTDDEKPRANYTIVRIETDGRIVEIDLFGNWKDAIAAYNEAVEIEYGVFAKNVAAEQIEARKRLRRPMETFAGSKDRSAAKQAFDAAKAIASRKGENYQVVRSLEDACLFGVIQEAEPIPVGWNLSALVEADGNVIGA